MRTIHAYGGVGDELTGEFFKRALAQARGGSVLVRINSQGGSVFEGNAISTLLRSYPGAVNATIDGIAASAASYFAMAATTLTMADGSYLMIHEPSAHTHGTFSELRNLSETLEKIRNDYARVYAERSGQDEGRIRAMMADETWLSASEAVELGFADAIEGKARMAAHVSLSEFRRVPDAVARMAAHGRPRLAEARAQMALVGWGASQSLKRDGNRTRVASRVHKSRSKFAR